MGYGFVSCLHGHLRLYLAFSLIRVFRARISCFCRVGVTCFTLLSVASTHADDFLIRIGDIDGFGYGAAQGFTSANGGPANVDQSGVLGNGDFLPDINQGGKLRDLGMDEFDFRNAAELANMQFQPAPKVSVLPGTTGSSFTDISLNTKYDDRSTSNQILIAGDPIAGLVRGPGGPFPSPPSSQLPNQPGFVFDFNVDNSQSEIKVDDSIYFNLIFADYDVTPAQIRITRADSSTVVIALRRQARNGSEDGLIQEATATLAFGDVFTSDGSTLHGFLKVDFVAPNEPYTAFDYVELSRIPLHVDVPEPSMIRLVLTLSVSMAGARRRT